MELSEAIEICEMATAKHLGPHVEDPRKPSPEIVVDEQDWLAAALVVLPRLRALQKVLEESRKAGITFTGHELTPFMQRCLENIREKSRIQE